MTRDQKTPTVITSAAAQPHHGTAFALSLMNRAGLASQLIIAG
jgi:hypothetical protein